MVAEAVAGLVAAAGQGTRLAAGPKAFVRVGDRSLLQWAVAGLEPVVDEIVVAVGADDVARARAQVPGAKVVPGGSTRQDTVARLLAETAAVYVLVHDAARPFLPADVARRVLAAAREAGAATAALKVADTIVDADTGETLARERLRAVQTPQGFERRLLREAHVRAAEDGTAATDDAALVRRLGRPVRLVEGSPLLHKITTPEDLRLAFALEALWLEQRSHEERRP
ncbi:MAG TPA: 2-C-methyl-D-erythritol 4-phosphate cytidylyltransferase [Trueperaceae bacterium]|nr:2-C-methyl-D-erythritol 4-phosphate cytidylyltransferase [Trueperaceae bacterium]